MIVIIELMFGYKYYFLCVGIMILVPLYVSIGYPNGKQEVEDTLRYKDI